MRQRKIKNEEERLSGHHKYLIQQPQEKKNRWHEIFNNNNEIFAEFGCGRGQFILTLAKLNPDRNYIAFEGRGSIIIRALEKADREGLENIMFIKEYVSDVNDYFEENELSGMYLNFSDPWPKDRHSKRRLTHRRYLEGYKKVLKNGSHIEFKSDNDNFFSFALNEFKNCGMKLQESTMDLHGTQLEAAKVTTEYEDKFRAAGKKINYCKVEV